MKLSQIAQDAIKRNGYDQYELWKDEPITIESARRTAVERHTDRKILIDECRRLLAVAQSFESRNENLYRELELHRKEIQRLQELLDKTQK